LLPSYQEHFVRPERKFLERCRFQEEDVVTFRHWFTELVTVFGFGNGPGADA
jgi:hypothetical protein